MSLTTSALVDVLLGARLPLVSPAGLVFVLEPHGLVFLRDATLSLSSPGPVPSDFEVTVRNVSLSVPLYHLPQPVLDLGNGKSTE